MSSTPNDVEVAEFNLNAVKAETNVDPFRFLWGTKVNPNRRFSMKHMEALNVWELMDAAEGGDVQAMIGIFKAALGDQWADFRATPLPQFKLKALFDAYREHCGVGSGESAASSDS